MATIDQQAAIANAAILAVNQSIADLNKQVIELTAYQNSINTEVSIPTIVERPNTDIYYLYSQNGVVNVAASNGGIIFPTGTTEERPSEAVGGTVRYNTDTQSLEIFTAGWEDVGTGIGGGGSGGGGAVQGIFYENSQEITANYNSANGKNIVSAGPLVLQLSNVFVSIANGSVWTVV